MARPEGRHLLESAQRGTELSLKRFVRAERCQVVYRASLSSPAQVAHHLDSMCMCMW